MSAVPVPDTRPRGVDAAVVARTLERRLMRIARGYASHPEDAEDACQRALEVLVRDAERLDPEWVEAWLHVVVRHEAFLLRRKRLRLVPTADEVLAARADTRAPAHEDLAEVIDLAERARRDVPRLKAQERRVLGLLAAGLSYREICSLTGWSYTKVNRCASEGRAALRQMGADAAGSDSQPRDTNQAV